MTETTRWRLLVSVSIGWSLLVVGLYALMMVTRPPGNVRELFSNAQAFFLWQGVGFALLSVGVSLVRPGLLGRLAALYLVVSTIMLLGLSRELSLPLVWLVFTLWGLFAINTTRLALKSFLGPEEATWGLAAGLLYSVLIPLSFLLGVLKLMTPAVVALLVGAFALPGLMELVRTRRRSRPSILRWLDALNPIGAFSLGVLWIVLALAFVWATTPETDSDSIRSYLPYIQQVARDGGFTLQYLDFGRLSVKALRAVHAFGFVVGSVDAAKWLSWFSVVALALLLVEEVYRRSGQRNLSLFASAAVITCPILLFLSKSLYHDHLITLLCVTAFVSLFRGLDRDSRRGVLLSAFVMGCAVQTKYNVLVFGVVWALALGVYTIRQKGLVAGLKWSVLPLLVLVGTGCPWFVYTFATTGNPFFPDFASWFPSSLPSESFHLEVFRRGLDRFTFGESIWDRLFFPWTITFHTTRLAQHPDGSMGFQMLALLPFLAVLVLLRQGRWRNGLDLALVGLAGFLGICLFTPYARYWLPVYPLLLIPLILLMGQSWDRTRWRLSRYTAPLAGVAIFTALLLTVPFWAAFRGGLPWKIYTNEVSDETWLARRFAGYQAIEQLNGFVEESDRVISTRYQAIFTVHADAYELPFWRTRVYGIEDTESFEKYLNDNAIRYWIVNHSHRDASFIDKRVEASLRYWTDERLVAAFSTVAVYDVSPGATPRRFKLLDSRVLEPVLLPHATPRDQRIDAAGWSDPFKDKPAQAARPAAQTIELPGQGGLDYSFTLPAAADLCRLSLYLSSDQGGSILSLSWLDAHRKPIETLQAGGGGGPPGRQSRIFSVIPEQARYGRLMVRPFRTTTLQVGEMKIDFFDGMRP